MTPRLPAFGLDGRTERETVLTPRTRDRASEGLALVEPPTLHLLAIFRVASLSSEFERWKCSLTCSVDTRRCFDIFSAPK